MTKISYIFINNGLGGSAIVALENIKFSSTNYKVELITNYKNKAFFVNQLLDYKVQIKTIYTEFDFRYNIPLIGIFKRTLTLYSNLLTRIFLTTFNPEIIHVHSTNSLFYIPTKAIKRKYSIFTVHETGGLFSELNNYYGFKKDYTFFANKLNTFSILTCASQKVLDNCKETLKNTNIKYILIPNGLNINKNNIEKKFVNISSIFIGGSIPVKNIYFILNLISKTSKSLLKQTHFHLNVLGNANKELGDYLNVHKLNSYVTLHGNLNLGQYHKLLRECNVYFNVSHHETIPNSLMDSLSYGLIPIVRDLNGFEILNNNKTCFILANEKDLNNLFIKFQDSKLMKQISNNVIYMSKHYTWDKINSEYNTIYKLQKQKSE